MKQLPPLEKASELFSYADDDCMFGLLEALVKMSSLLSHPVLQRKRWESDVYEHLQQEADSLQKCFLGVASVAVVKYLQQTSSKLTRDMPRILDTCYDMLKTAPNDPSQVIAIIPKIRAQLRDAEREGRRKSLEADALLDILYELATEFSAGSASTSNSAETSSSTDEARQSRSYPDSSEQPTRKSVSAAMQEESNVDHFFKQQPLISSTIETGDRRGLAADFFDAPSPGPEGFPSAVLKELEDKQAKSSQSHRRIDGEATKVRPKKESKPESEKKSSSPGSKQNSPRRIEEQEGDSLLMAQKPETVAAQPIARRSQETVQMDPEGRSSSSSSDDGYHSGLEAAPNLPIILRKKLEGKKRASPKLAIATKLSILGTLPEERSPVHEGRSRTGKGSRTKRSSPIETIGKRVPGSYFPAADILLETMKAEETTKSQPRLRSRPVSSNATIYTPVTASPLRASISVSPEASAKPKVKEELGVQRPTSTVSSPTGVLFSNPFSNDVDGSADIDLGPIPDVNAASPVADTGEITNSNNSLASSKSSLVQTIEATEDEMVFMTPMASPTTVQDFGDILEEIEDAQEEVTDIGDISDTDSIQSTEVLTSADIQAGLLSDRHMSDDDLIDRGPEPLTEAEKDLAAREPEALVPGPRGMVTSQDVRNHSISYNDFSNTYTGAVPRVEVTPGAIQNTRGEVIPIDDEVIHLKAGETLIDGTGRVWNSKGMIEPGRDDQGNAILYEVDIAQIKRANNGVMPAMMPWDDEELMSDSRERRAMIHRMKPRVLIRLPRWMTQCLIPREGDLVGYDE
ncbi:hypothetical protein QFC19_001263 [Naganishia cerealis]|uniref:Uncharacterized protein n=1 Tax=Naganishia cerealis TaxID=610337 RepID=A0ACC2WI94_9TREE|nr:hypothetical protein QFC19_001263 [Naganishia cerealis]